MKSKGERERYIVAKAALTSFLAASVAWPALVTAKTFDKLSAPAQQKVSQAPMNDNGRNVQGDLNIYLTEREGFGVTVDARDGSPPEGLDHLSRLIKVDDIPIKGLSIDEVRALLCGPVGTTVKLQVLNIHRQMTIVIMERKPVAFRSPAPSQWVALDKAADILDEYDCDDLPRVYINASSGCEPFDTALTAAALSVANKWFDSKSFIAIETLARSAAYYDEVGRIAEADKTINKAIEAVNCLEQANIFSNPVLLNFAQHLKRTGRWTDADLVYRKLVECWGKDVQSGNTQVETLSKYAIFLAERGRTTEAESSFEQLLHLSENNKLSRNILLAADFFNSIGKADRAISLYLQHISAIETQQSETQRAGDRDQPLAEALYRLAIIQDRLSRTKDAVATLQKAQSVYAKRLDPVEQIDVESMPLFFPTLSDIDIKLAEMLYKNSDFAGAKSQLKEAVELIEKALGPTSPYLKKPLQDLARSYEASGDSAEAAQITERAAAIAPLRETCVQAEDDTIYATTTLASKSIMAKELNTAAGATDELLLLFKITDDRKTMEYRRSQGLWRTLTYLCSAYIDQKAFQQAEQLQERLIEKIRTGGEPDTVLIPVLVDRAVFAEQLGLPKEKSWCELQEALLTKYPSGPTTPPFGEALRRIALAYSFNHDYKRAAPLFDRAWAIEIAPTNKNDQSDPIEITSALKADLALLDLHLKRFERATASIDNILSGSCLFGPQTARKLALIANLYDQIGRSKEAEDILTRAMKQTVYPVTRESIRISSPVGFLDWKLASRLAKHNPNKAYELAVKACEQYKPVGIPPGLSVLSADLALAHGDYTGAARQYLALQQSVERFSSFDPGMQELGQALGRKALDAVQLAKEIPQQEHYRLLKEIADSLRNSDRGRAITLYKQALHLAPTNSKESADIAQRIASLSFAKNDPGNEPLQAQSRAADLAQKAGLTGAYHSWLSLAMSELRAHQVEQAIAHIDHALDLFANSRTLKMRFSPPISDRQMHSIGEALRKAGRSTDLERLLLKMAKVTRDVYGPSSDEEAEAIAELALFYTNEKNYEALDAIVKEILRIYYEHGAKVPQSSGSHDYEAIRRLYETMTLLIEQKESARGIAIAKEILSVQRLKLEPKDRQLPDTLIALGSFYKEAKEFDRAAPYYQEAWETAKLHWGGRTEQYYRSEYAEVLRKQGKTAEAVRLMTVQADQESAMNPTEKLPSPKSQRQSQPQSQNSLSQRLEQPAGPAQSPSVVNFTPYLADLERRIRRAWFPPKRTEKP